MWTVGRASGVYSEHPHYSLVQIHPRYRGTPPNNAGIDCRNDIHSSVEICLRDTGFPCVRKASLYSRLTISYEGNRQPNKYLLALAQVGYRMRIPIELAKIRALTHGFLLGSPPLREGGDAREVLVTT
jgi:hypothetical protein